MMHLDGNVDRRVDSPPTSTLLEYENDAFPQQLAIIREKRKNICHPSGIQIPMDMVKVYVHMCC